MVNIRNIKRKNPFKHVLLRKSFSYFPVLEFFHNNNNISPGDLFFSNRFSIIKPCRFSVKTIFENILSGLASVLVLIADKQYLHTKYIEGCLNINFSLAHKHMEEVTIPTA